MTKDEFKSWLTAHKRLFPEVAEWLAERGDAAPFVLEEWFKALAHITAARMQAITRQMITGAIQHPDRWSISRLPAAFCAIVPRVPTIEELNRGGVQP